MNLTDRLITAIEGECDGLSITAEQASNILAYLQYGAPMNTTTNTGAASLSDEQIEKGWRDTFSTDNPYCPCNLKSFTKAVRWAERDIAPTPQADAGPLPREAATVPKGFALVPLKPTAEIVKAGGQARIEDFNRNGTTLSVKDANRVAEAMYRAMVGAANGEQS
jgi:hypothetical protein